MKVKALLMAILCLSSLFHPSLTAQNDPPIDLNVQVTYAEFIGKISPLKDLLPMPAADPEKRALRKKKIKTIPNFQGRGQRPVPNPNAGPAGPDQVWQSPLKNNFNFDVEPVVNIDGINSGLSGSNPPDPDGDIGKTVYVQVVNATYIQVFDKEGNSVGEPFTANTLWNSIGFSSAGDPVIIYDQEADRWILTEFPSGNQLLVAISDSEDPLGSWNAYNFSTPNFPDYPKYSLWPNAIVVTTNEQGSAVAPVYLINREDLLNGEPMVMIQRIEVPGNSDGPGFQVATPVDWSGSVLPPLEAAPMILQLNDDEWGPNGEDEIKIVSFDIDWQDSDNTTMTVANIPLSPFDTYPCAAATGGFACIPQPNGNGIDGLQEVIMNQVHYRNFDSHEGMVLNFITDASGDNLSGIRWVELRRLPGADWALYQEGTYAPEHNTHRFMGAIAMDKAGNIGLAYSVSGLETFPSIRFTGRRVSDPLGEMTVNEYEVIAGSSNASSVRFGDYASLAVDPANDMTFWFTGEYMQDNGWGTRIFSFNISRDTIDIGPTALFNPQDSPDLTAAEPVRIEVKNFGLDTQSVFSVGYIFEGGAPISEMVDTLLPPDSTYIHLFTPTVDMSLVGEYEFKIFTSLPVDQAPFNDTLRAIVSKLSRSDAGITAIDGLNELICSDSVSISLIITNMGTDSLTSAQVFVELNAMDTLMIDWQGNLPSGGSDTIQVMLSPLLNGQNEVYAFTSNPNGVMDEIPENDGLSRSFNVINNGVPVFLELLTDNFSYETTWVLAGESGEMLYTGGPYDESGTLFLEAWCLDPDSCYEFTIFDAYGDGICCDFGEGNYTIVDAEGQHLLSGDGNFGSQETGSFCATFACLVSAEALTSPESVAGAQDGTLILTAINGTSPYQYSIDGGLNFQSTALFNGLTAGDYHFVVEDAQGCIYEDSVNVSLCAIEIMAEVINESVVGASDGEVVVNTSGGLAPLLYSIDGGLTFQDSSWFTGLSEGFYDITVMDSIGCAGQLQVMIDITTGIRQVHFGAHVELYPNPNKGLFRIDVSGLSLGKTLLPFQVLDANGNRLQSNTLAKYDHSYTGQVTLQHYPAGIYFIQFNEKGIKRLIKVLKQ